MNLKMGSQKKMLVGIAIYTLSLNVLETEESTEAVNKKKSV